MRDFDYYKRVLKITGVYDEETLKKAFREAVKQNHPDLFKNPINKKLATEKMKIINEAYDFLKNNIDRQPKPQNNDDFYKKSYEKKDSYRENYHKQTEQEQPKEEEPKNEQYRQEKSPQQQDIWNLTVLLPIITGIVILLSFFRVPYTIYMILRVLVCLTFLNIFLTLRKYCPTWIIVLCIVGIIIYNPVFPMHLQKGVWQLMNMGILAVIINLLNGYFKNE